jgi:2-keto-myo-inositol isomerase
LAGNLEQIRNLKQGGYEGPLSFEPFAVSVQRMEDIAFALRESMIMLAARLTPKASP